MNKNTSVFVMGAVASLMSISASAYEVDLTGLGYVQYGDGLSYSMPVANYQYGYNTNNGPFAIASTPGQIKDLIVVATGSSGTPVTTNESGFDNAYATPSGASGNEWFNPETGTYQGTTGTVVNNGDNTWDASVEGLLNFAGSDQLVFFFNNNNENSGPDGSSSSQSLAAWANMWITSPDGTVISPIWEFSNNSSGCTVLNPADPACAAISGSDGNPYALVTEGGGGTFFGDPTSFVADSTAGGGPVNTSFPDSTDYVLAGGAICVDTTTIIPVPIPCDAPNASAPINHNLGADHVAYAILFPELNAFLNALALSGEDLSLFTFHLDVRLGCQDATGGWDDCSANLGWGNELNNGYEQIFIGRAKVGDCPEDDPLCNPTVPEPASVLLLGLGLFGLTYYRRKQLLSRA